MCTKVEEQEQETRKKYKLMVTEKDYKIARFL